MDDRLRLLRTELGLTQMQMAEKLEISQRTYSHYEAGDREPPFSILKKICRLFDVSADYLLGLVDTY